MFGKKDRKIANQKAMIKNRDKLILNQNKKIAKLEALLINVNTVCNSNLYNTNGIPYLNKIKELTRDYQSNS